MAKPPAIGIRLDPTSADYGKLLKMSGRIAQLLELADAQKNKYLRDTLDLFLGAVYALVLAKHGSYEHRPKQTESDKVVVRARDVESGWIRLDGKWMSGFHFNSALFRISAVYHRSLKIATARLTGQEKVRGLVERVKADPQYKTWKNVSAQAVHVEVTDMKHQPEGLHDKRKVTPSQACYACEEILDLLEMFRG